MQIAIVGAGISGLLAARELVDQGHEVRVFDKARGPGGRMATRRIGDLAFDHGAPSFSVRDARFRDLVDAWIAAGVAAVWTPRRVRADGGALHAARDDTSQVVGAPRMSAITRHLAQGLEVVCDTRVQHMARRPRGWDLVGPSGPLGRFEAVLVTTPPEQAHALLEDAPELACVAARVPSEACWAVMAAFPRALGTAFDAVEVASGPLAGATRNTSKPGRPPGEAWVLHADPAWSRHHVDDEPGSVGEALVAAFFTATGIPAVAPLHVAVHRWLLARAERPLDAGACWDARARVGVAGDWCHGGDVEGAARSAWSLVGQVQGGS